MLRIESTKRIPIWVVCGFSVILLSQFFVTQASGAFDFGDNWSYGSCTYQTKEKVCVKYKKNKCTKYETKSVTKSIPTKHVGKDVYGKDQRGYYVYVTRDLYYVQKHPYSNGWETGVFMQTSNVSSKDNKTYSVLHLKDVPRLNPGENLKGKLIGRVADKLGTKDNPSGPHLHIGYRTKSYYDNTLAAWAGALPPKECTGGRIKGLPDYKEAFLDPDTSIVTVEKNKRK